MQGRLEEEGITVVTYASDSVVLRRAVEAAREKQVGGGGWEGRLRRTLRCWRTPRTRWL